MIPAKNKHRGKGLNYKRKRSNHPQPRPRAQKENLPDWNQIPKELIDELASLADKIRYGQQPQKFEGEISQSWQNQEPNELREQKFEVEEEGEVEEQNLFNYGSPNALPSSSEEERLDLNLAHDFDKVGMEGLQQDPTENKWW